MLFIIIVWSSSSGPFLIRGTVTFALLCDTPSRYCIKYSNGTLHDVLTFELIAIISAGLAIIGYLRASSLQKQQKQQRDHQMVQRQSELQRQIEESDDNTVLLEHNDNGVST